MTKPTPEAEKVARLPTGKPLTHEELLKKISENPRFRVVRSFGQGFVIVGAKRSAKPTTE